MKVLLKILLLLNTCSYKLHEGFSNHEDVTKFLKEHVMKYSGYMDLHEKIEKETPFCQKTANDRFGTGSIS